MCVRVRKSSHVSSFAPVWACTWNYEPSFCCDINHISNTIIFCSPWAEFPPLVCDDLQVGLLSSDANEVLKTVYQSDLKCHTSGERKSVWAAAMFGSQTAPLISPGVMNNSERVSWYQNAN